MFNKNFAVAIAAASLLWAPLAAQAAATITIVNIDAAGVGFNDTTPAAPVGGNTGTTLGQQRLNVFAAAAATWAATLTSTVPIRVRASFAPLTCTATSAVLGSAGPSSVFRDFPGALVANRWYNSALADKLSGTDLDPAGNDINTSFNGNLGQPNCLTGTFFYLGLDNNEGTNIDLLATVTHELGHGLGFLTVTSGSTGAFLSGFPSIWDNFLFDTLINKSWSTMTNAERSASALNGGRLIWTGTNVTNALPSVLQGAAQVAITTPASVSGSYQAGRADFGPPLSNPGVTGLVVAPFDTAPNLSLACNPLSSKNAALVTGKIALLDRGTCGFTIKVKNAQNAGAIGVIIADNVAGSPPPGLGGTDATITIPSVRITQADGNTFKAVIATGSRGRSGLTANLGISLSVFSGSDAIGRALMYAPNPFQSGSSVSHFDISAFPNLLMEPAITNTLTGAVAPPLDLTFPLLRDTGW